MATARHEGRALGDRPPVDRARCAKDEGRAVRDIRTVRDEPRGHRRKGEEKGDEAENTHAWMLTSAKRRARRLAPFLLT
jgi:hypothetical protein